MLKKIFFFFLYLFTSVSAKRKVSMAKDIPVWEARDPILLAPVEMESSPIKKDTKYMIKYQTMATMLPSLALVKKT